MNYLAKELLGAGAGEEDEESVSAGALSRHLSELLKR
jgi:hypothetical protein